MRTKYVEVEFDVTEWDDDELLEEVEARGLTITGNSTDETLRTIHQLIKFGKKDEAYEAMYSYIKDKLGVAI